MIDRLLAPIGLCINVAVLQHRNHCKYRISIKSCIKPELYLIVLFFFWFFAGFPLIPASIHAVARSYYYNDK